MNTKDHLIEKVKAEIEDLLNREHKPRIQSDIDAVWVFSGPGTLSEPLKKDDPYWTKWMDKYRILYGISLIKEITALRLGNTTGEVSPSDIQKKGPYFIYNGTEEENDALKKIVFSDLSILPRGKVIIIESFIGEDGAEEIKNTLDQIKSFAQEDLGKRQILKNKIALVSHAQHFPRILRYIEKYQLFPEKIKVEVFSLKPPEEYSDRFTEEEAKKVWEYFLQGDLSYYPAKTEV